MRPSPGPRLIVALAFLAMAGCAGEPAEPDPGGPRVEEREQLGAAWACDDPAACTGDYLAFPGRAAERARPISRAELESWFDDCRYGRVEVLREPLAPEVLRAELLDALNIGFMTEGLDERLLRTTVIRREERGDHREIELLFDDPLVGTFQGILLLPPGPGPHPGIVALHGHSDSAEEFRDRYHGLAYPPAGFAILMLTLRVMSMNPYETEVTWALLESGFNLIGLRVYEGLLGLKYLRWREDVDAGRLGLIGHSGGSSAGNLLVRIEPRLRATISDHMVAYMTAPADRVHCETVPAVFPYNRLINFFHTSEVPVLFVTYGYPEGPGELIEFFGRHLR